jgi:hypothetical protein
MFLGVKAYKARGLRNRGQHCIISEVRNTMSAVEARADITRASRQVSF